MEGAVEGVQLCVDGLVFGNGMEDEVAGGGDLLLEVADGVDARGGGTEDGGTEGAGLLGLADFHGLAKHVCVDLHEGMIFDGEAAGVDDFVNGDAVFFDALDDGEGAEGGGFDVGAVDFVGLGVEGLAEEEAGELDVNEDGAIAVIPVEGEEARGTGFLGGHSFFHGGEFFADGGAVAFGDDVVDEPEEEVADGALAGFDAVETGKDGAVDDAADAWDVGEGFVGGGDHEIAGAGAEDFDEGPGFDAGSDSAHVGVEGTDGDGDAGFEAELFGPGGAEVAGFGVGAVGFGEEAVAEVGEVGVELGEEFFVGEAAPFVTEEGFVAGGTDAALEGEGVGVAGEFGGEPVAVFDEGVGGGEDGGVDAAEAEDFGPEPFGGVDTTAFGHDVGALFVAELGDLGGFGMGGVVFPEPDHGVEVISEFGEEAEGCASLVDGYGSGACGVEADADDGGGVEGGVGGFGLGDGGGDNVDEAVEVVLGVLAGDVGVGGIEEDTHVTAGIGEDGGAEFGAVGEVDEEGAAGVGAVVDSESVHGAGRRGWGCGCIGAGRGGNASWSVWGTQRLGGFFLPQRGSAWSACSLLPEVGVSLLRWAS